jgi:hypothetical protein
MSKIYGRATEVLAWLGRERDDSRWLFQTIAQIHQNPYFDFSNLNPPEERMMRTITKLWNRSYWKRVWIIQEILSASNLSLYCGAESLPWTVYENILVTGWRPQHSAGGTISILHKLSGELQKVHFIPVAEIMEMGSVIMSNDKPSHLPLSRHDTAANVLRLLRSNIHPQDYHRCQALEKQFKRSSDSENFFATSEGLGEDAIIFRWHYPTDGKCRIIEPIKDHIGIASCKTQVGDMFCFAEGVKNLCVILRLLSSVSGATEVSDVEELILVGRVIFLDSPNSTSISL